MMAADLNSFDVTCYADNCWKMLNAEKIRNTSAHFNLHVGYC